MNFMNNSCCNCFFCRCFCGCNRCQKHDNCRNDNWNNCSRPCHCQNKKCNCDHREKECDCNRREDYKWNQSNNWNYGCYENFPRPFNMQSRNEYSNFENTEYYDEF